MSKGRHIRAYDYVNQPYEEVRQALHADPGDMFRDATRAAASRARSVASELSVNIGGVEVGAEVDITVCAVEDVDKGPLGKPATRIELAKAARLFPFMKARLSAYALTATETQLDMEGDYEPPLGVVGAAVDAAVGHRIAEASVRRFMTNVAAHLRERMSGGS
jgi:hypothetical protein